MPSWSVRSAAQEDSLDARRGSGELATGEAEPQQAESLALAADVRERRPHGRPEGIDARDATRETPHFARPTGTGEQQPAIVDQRDAAITTPLGNGLHEDLQGIVARVAASRSSFVHGLVIVPQGAERGLVRGHPRLHP